MLNKIGTDTYNGQPYDVYMLVGNATKDAEIRSTPAGKQVAKVNVAAKKNSDSTTMFVTVSGWGRLTGVVADIKKGASIMAIGKLKKNEFNGRTYWDLNADFVSAAGSSTFGSLAPVHQANKSSGFEELPDSEEVLPF